MVEEVDAGASVSQVARRHGIHSSQLFRWRRELATAAVEGPASATFVPVVVAPHQRVPLQSLSRPSTASNSSLIEIMIAQGRVVVRVAGNVDTVALVRIIDALEARR